MLVCIWVYMSVLLRIADGFIVRGSSGPLVVPLGASVVLPCSVDKPLLIEGLEVEWRRTDSETLVHLFQDGESRPETQQQDYHDRAHFFTEEIQHGNFSLLLKNVRAEDKGGYRCTVHSDQDSAETVVEIKDVERLIVSGSNHSVSAYPSEDVTLSCSMDSHIPPEEIEQVSWKKTDENKILVLLFQSNEILSESSDERYRDRVEFFTDEIPKGNFSLRLKSVRTEDKGVYVCEVTARGFSADATVVLEQLGFSGLHIMVLMLCIAASGSALLICSLIYCRNNTDVVFHLQMSLVFCPNILMFVAFVLWGFTEGSLNETASCCALYFLRPLMLLWAAPYFKVFTGVIETLVLKYSYQAEYAVLSAVVYAALLNHVWGKILSYVGFERVIIIILFGIVFLCCFCKIIYILVAKIGKKTGQIIGIFDIVADMGFEILPALQFMLLFYSFGVGGGFIIIIILPLLLTMTNERWFFRCKYGLGCSRSVIGIVQNIVMLLMTAVMMGFYIITLENEKEPIGWACVIGFLQILWAVWKSLDISDFYRPFKRDFPRYVPLYLFGSVGVVLLNSVTLMTELILKTVNGERSVGDLRFVVFPAECLFVLAVVISAMFESRIKTCLQSCQNAVKSIITPASRSQQNQSSQNAAGSEETPASGSNQNQNLMN